MLKKKKVSKSKIKSKVNSKVKSKRLFGYLSFDRFLQVLRRKKVKKDEVIIFEPNKRKVVKKIKFVSLRVLFSKKKSRKKVKKSSRRKVKKKKK